MKPLVSIVMPCYNVEDYLSDAINSILNSDYDNYEVIAIDDGSTDNTRDILIEFAKKSTKIKIITNKQNMGLIYSLNRGIKESSGSIIVRFDPDDIMFPYTLRKQVNALLNKNCNFVFGDSIIIDENGKEYGRTKFRFWKLKYISYINPILHNTVAFYKKLILKYGSYNSRCVGYEDQELWYRFLRNNVKFCYINVPLVKYRIRKTSSQKRDYTDYYFLIAKYLLNHSNKLDTLKLLPMIKKRKNKIFLLLSILMPEKIYFYLSILKKKILFSIENNIYRPKKI